MRKLLITTGGTEHGWSRHNEEGVFRDYEAEVNRLYETAKPYNLEFKKFDNEYFFSRPYYFEHKDIMDEVNFGNTFKAIELYETFKEMEYGDMIIHTDSNHIVSNNPDIIYNIINEHEIFTYDHWGLKFYNKDFTNRDTFVNMGCDEEKYWDSLQMQVNLIGFKKTPKTVDFITEFFNDCLTYNIIFGEDKYPNFEGFRVHRHDQSIFSILRVKYNYPYVDRTTNNWINYIIQEESVITPTTPIVDNRYRIERDRKHNK